MACSKCGGGTTLTFSTLVEKDGSILPTLKYVQCAYNEQWTEKFKAIGLPGAAEESKLQYVAWLSDTGNDVKGHAIGADGKPVSFSVQQILQSIDTSKPTKSNCSI